MPPVTRKTTLNFLNPDKKDHVQGSGQTALIATVNQKGSEIPTVFASEEMQRFSERQISAKLDLEKDLHRRLGVKVRIELLGEKATDFGPQVCPKGTTASLIGGHGKPCSMEQIMESTTYARHLARHLSDFPQTEEPLKQLWDHGIVKSDEGVLNSF